MASGVKVHDDVTEAFKEINVRHHGEKVEDRYKFLVFKIVSSHILVDTERTVRVKDLDGCTDIFKKVVAQLPLKECRYALYDCHYETNETNKDDLVFIFWGPEGATLKDKMLYASSKGSIRKVFTGLKYEWQVNDVEDIKDNKCLIEKLGGSTNCPIKSLEGHVL